MLGQDRTDARARLPSRRGPTVAAQYDSAEGRWRSEEQIKPFCVDSRIQ
jgi:hypothetical protein